MIPNASLLSFLTLSTKDEEKIIFLHLKQVNDIAPPSLHWYKDKGQNGDAKWLWQEKALKQWLLIAEDPQVRIIFDSLLSQKNYSFTFKSSTINFTIPESTIEVRDTSIYTIEGVDSIGRNELPTNFKALQPIADIDFLINEATNCKYIEGYKLHPSIKPIYPSGLLSENSLLGYVNRQICAQFEPRGIYIDFKGNGKDKQTGDSTSLSGFIQLPDSERVNTKIIIRTLGGERQIGNSEIDVKTGKWETILTEPAGQGQILLSDRLSNRIISGEKFYLLKDITVNAQAVSVVIRDLFGREIHVPEQKRASPEEMVVWDFNAAPDERQGQIELSDKLKNIISSLGKSVTFFDPYFFGDIKHDNNTLKLGLGQEVFFNALITSLIVAEIEEIRIVGYWQRAKNQSSVQKSEYFNNYKLLYKLIVKNLGKPRADKLKSFLLINSKESFHDRYWQGDNEIYYLSNSINGAYESHELTIQKQDELSKLKLLAKFNRRLAGEIYDLKSENVF